MAGTGFSRLALSSSLACFTLSISSDVVAALDCPIRSDSAKMAAMGSGRSTSSARLLRNDSTIEKAVMVGSDTLGRRGGRFVDLHSRLVRPDAAAQRERGAARRAGVAVGGGCHARVP